MLMKTFPPARPTGYQRTRSASSSRTTEYALAIGTNTLGCLRLDKPVDAVRELLNQPSHLSLGASWGNHVSLNLAIGKFFALISHVRRWGNGTMTAWGESLPWKEVDRLGPHPYDLKVVTAMSIVQVTNVLDELVLHVAL